MWVEFNQPHAILTDYYPISSVSLQSRCRVLLICIPDFRCTAHFHESRIDDKNLLNSVWVWVWNKIYCTWIFICVLASLRTFPNRSTPTCATVIYLKPRITPQFHLRELPDRKLFEPRFFSKFAYVVLDLCPAERIHHVIKWRPSIQSANESLAFALKSEPPAYDFLLPLLEITPFLCLTTLMFPRLNTLQA